jgi:hypothetical protein
MDETRLPKSQLSTDLRRRLMMKDPYNLCLWILRSEILSMKILERERNVTPHLKNHRLICESRCNDDKSDENAW